MRHECTDQPLELSACNETARTASGCEPRAALQLLAALPGTASPSAARSKPTSRVVFAFSTPQVRALPALCKFSIANNAR